MATGERRTMSKGFHDISRATGRRGFFRQLAISAIETVEQVGREMADRGLQGFREPPRYTPPPLDRRYIDPQFRVYGPPWPPPYGPPVTAELRRKLKAARELERQKIGLPVARDASQTI